MRTIETLEPRRLFYATLVDGVLHLGQNEVGSSFSLTTDDQGGLTVLVTGEGTTTFPLASIDRIEITSRGGFNNPMHVSADIRISRPIQINGGVDEDNVLILGSAGSDTVTINTTSIQADNTLISFDSSLNRAQINADDGDDLVTFASTRQSMGYMVFGEAGNDTCIVSPAETVSVGAQAIYIDGGVDDDHCTVAQKSPPVMFFGNDGMNAVTVLGTEGNDVFDFDGTSVSTGYAKFNYPYCSKLSVFGYGGDDRFTVNKLPQLDQTIFDGGAGSDSFTYHFASGSILPLTLPAMIAGDSAADIDTLGIIDSRGAGQSYQIDETAIHWLGDGFSVPLAGFEHLDFNSGSKADQFTVTPSRFADFNIHAGEPDTAPGDSFTLDAGSADLVGYTPPNSSASDHKLTFAAHQQIRFSGFEARAGWNYEPPALIGAVYSNDYRQQIVATFDTDVSASIQPLDVYLIRSGQSGRTYASAVDVVLDPAGQTRAEFRFAGELPDGRYTAILPPGVFANRLGVPSMTGRSVAFNVLRADINGSGTVDFTDLVILAQHYGTRGNLFSQGNVNYDAEGRVDFNDLTILAQRYGRSLPAAMTLTAPTPSKRQRHVDILV